MESLVTEYQAKAAVILNRINNTAVGIDVPNSVDSGSILSVNADLKSDVM